MSRSLENGGPTELRLEVLADPAALATRIAEWLLALAVAKEGAFAIALSGGSTPRRLYETMAGEPFSGTFPWTRIHWFWGDERFVPRKDPLSNYRMVDKALLSRVEIPPENIHGVPFDGLKPEAAAKAYQRELASFYGADELDPGRPLFDVTLLGLGEDGHTASLFPGTTVLKERVKWAAAVIGAKEEPRITLTYPALESSRQTAFLVTGKDKRAMLGRLLAGDEALPAAGVRPVGTAWAFADEAAAPENPGTGP